MCIVLNYMCGIISVQYAVLHISYLSVPISLNSVLVNEHMYRRGGVVVIGIFRKSTTGVFA